MQLYLGAMFEVTYVALGITLTSFQAGFFGKIKSLLNASHGIKTFFKENWLLF